MIRIYTLTGLGTRLARSVSNPNSPAYRIVHYLDQSGNKTIEQIADYCGLSTREAAGILRGLKRKGLVTEVSEVTA